MESYSRFNLIISFINGLLIYIVFWFSFDIPYLDFFPSSEYRGLTQYLISYITVAIGIVILNVSASGILEKLLFLSWGGAPLRNILQGKYLKYLDREKLNRAKKLIKNESQNTVISDKEIFDFAEINGSYPFSDSYYSFRYYFLWRSFFISSLICSALLLYKFQFNIIAILILLLIDYSLWAITKKYAYKYTEAVFLDYLMVNRYVLI